MGSDVFFTFLILVLSSWFLYLLDKLKVEVNKLVATISRIEREREQEEYERLYQDSPDLTLPPPSTPSRTKDNSYLPEDTKYQTWRRP